MKHFEDMTLKERLNVARQCLIPEYRKRFQPGFMLNDKLVSDDGNICLYLNPETKGVEVHTCKTSFTFTVV